MEIIFANEDNAVTNEATVIQDPGTLSQAGAVNGDMVG
jgi:hypothetical protein